MSYSPRVWLAVASACCVLALVAPVHAIDPNHLPGDTEGILTINLRQILESELARTNKDGVAQVKFLVESYLADEQVQRYLEKMDFDLFRDLKQITITTAGSKSPEFILLEGKFHPEKVRAAGEEASRDHVDHIKPVMIGTQRAFEIRPTNDEKPLFAGVVGQDKLIATSSREGYADAVARLNGSKKSNVRKELRELFGPQSAKQSIGLVTTGPALARMLDDAPVPNIEALQALLQGVAALSIAVTVEQNVGFELGVNSKDKQAAEEMVKLTSVGLAAAKIMLKKRAENDPKLASALDIVSSMRVTSQGNNFILRGEITAKALEKILKDLPK